MKIKLFVNIVGPMGRFEAGEEVDLPEEMAKGLLRERYAESLEVAVTPQSRRLEKADSRKNISLRDGYFDKGQDKEADDSKVRVI